MLEITKFKFKLPNKRVIPVCSYCLETLVEKPIKLEEKIFRFFEKPKEINFCSKKCKKEYINNNPLVAYQISQINKKS
jgi:hypothetical protein